MTPRVVFITAHYGRASDTLFYLESLDRQLPSPENFQVFVVDNGSSDEDARLLEEAVRARPHVTLLQSRENLGYFRALNFALAQIPDKTRSRVVIGNNDLGFREDFVAVLSTIETPPSTLVLAPDIVTLDGYHQNPHRLRRLSSLKKFAMSVYFSNYGICRLIRNVLVAAEKARPRRPQAGPGTAQFIHMGVGACYVLTEGFFSHFQKLDDRVFMWGEEALLAGQVSSAGGRIYYAPRLAAVHRTTLRETKFKRDFSRREFRIVKESFRVYKEYL